MLGGLWSAMAYAQHHKSTTFRKWQFRLAADAAYKPFRGIIGAVSIRSTTNGVLLNVSSAENYNSKELSGACIGGPAQIHWHDLRRRCPYKLITTLQLSVQYVSSSKASLRLFQLPQSAPETILHWWNDRLGRTWEAQVSLRLVE